MAAPNILLVMADQLAPHFTSTYGHPVVATPHLDSIAERGVRFTLLAGRSVSAIGAWDIREAVLESQRSRHAIHRATERTAGLRSWDHLPANDVANHYVRNHQDVVDAALTSRLHLSAESP